MTTATDSGEPHGMGTEEVMEAKKVAVVVAGLALSAALVVPSAFAGWGRGRGCDGPGRYGGRQQAPCAQQYEDPRGGGRSRGPGDCYRDEDGRGRRGGERRGDCRGPRDCGGPQDCPQVEPPRGPGAPDAE